MTVTDPASVRADDGIDPSMLVGPSDRSSAAHLARWGPLPTLPGDRVVDELRRAGLRGRGGGGFPTAEKLAVVRRSAASNRRRPVVVANGIESEPLSLKDRTLLAANPHLVLDGVALAARAVGADLAFLCVGAEGAALVPLLRRLIDGRPPGEVPVELVVAPPRYVASEESALVNWLANGRPLPTVVPPRPAERGVWGRPTLVDNVETLATLAVIARVGVERWGSGGTPEEPGSMLVTVGGAVGRPGVRQVPFGAPLAEVLDGAAAGPAAGVLVGGYFGTWLTEESARGAHLSRRSLALVGATPGCGVVAVLPPEVCPVAEVAAVARWLAGQSAGQCGPCARGLPAIAGALDAAAAGGPVTDRAVRDAQRWSAMVRGRGACKMPDGAVGFVTSALEVFGDHLRAHRAGRCPAGPAGGRWLPVPGWSR